MQNRFLPFKNQNRIIEIKPRKLDISSKGIIFLPTLFNKQKINLLWFIKSTTNVLDNNNSKLK